MSASQSYAAPPMARRDEWWINALLIFVIGTFVLSVAMVVAPAVAAGLLVFVVVKTTDVRWGWIALVAVAAFVVLNLLDLGPLDVIEKTFRRANNLAQRKGPDIAIKRIWNHRMLWWERALPTVPIGAFIGALLGAVLETRYAPFDSRAELQKRKAIEVGRNEAARKTAKTPETIKDLGVLGPYSHGDLRQPWVQRHRGTAYLCLDPVLLGRHVVVVGKPGSGKTTTLLRLSYLAAKVYGWRVYFLDGKGDTETMREFTALMLAAGVTPGEIAAFPNQPLDGWRTSGDDQTRYSQLLNRFMGTLTFSEPYYRDMTRRFLSRALRAGDSLPSTSHELLQRLEKLAVEAPAELRQEARTTHARLEALFDAFPGDFDGEWSFSDHRAAYVLLKGLANRDEAQAAAGLLFECFKQYAANGKHPAEKVLLVVDEFPAVMGDSDAAGMIERLRSFGCGIAISGQSYDGLGDDRARIVESAGTLILHRLSASDELARLAGTVQDFAVTSQIDFAAGATGRGSATPEHRFKAEPNAIGRQADGEITLVADRSVGHAFVTRVDPASYVDDADECVQSPQHAQGWKRQRPIVRGDQNVIELR